MCSVATKLVTSLDFNPIRFVITLCHFGRTRNGYAATRSILFSSTAESSATRGTVVIPERFGRNEKPAVSNKERARKKLSLVRLVPKVDLIDAIVLPSMYFFSMNV